MDTTIGEPVEVDLSDALGDFDPPAQDASRESQIEDAHRSYAAAIDHASQGRLDQAIAAFEAAAHVPLMRFQAGTRLGRLHVAHGDLARGVEWLEKAAQAPATTPDEGHAVLYELADALEHLGEHTRALSALMQLSADAGSYRDIAARIDRLSKVQTRG